MTAHAGRGVRAGERRARMFTMFTLMTRPQLRMDAPWPRGRGSWGDGSHHRRGWSKSVPTREAGAPRARKGCAAIVSVAEGFRTEGWPACGQAAQAASPAQLRPGITPVMVSVRIAARKRQEAFTKLPSSAVISSMDEVIDLKLFTVALREVPTDEFERFGQAFYGAIEGTSFVPLGGTGDGGADGLFEQQGSSSRSRALQISKQADLKAKAKSTVQRLREFGRDPKSLTMLVSYNVQNLDTVEEELSDWPD